MVIDIETRDTVGEDLPLKLRDTAHLERPATRSSSNNFSSV